MDIILLERIENLGQMGDVVTVKDGYARNYLLPQKKALRASKENIAYFETQKKELEARNLERRTEAEAVAKAMEGHVCTLERQAGETGQLYGSVTARDVTDSLLDAGYNIERGQVILDNPIKELGVFTVDVALHPEVHVKVKVNVARTADEAERQLADLAEAAETEKFFETEELAKEAEEQLSSAAGQGEAEKTEEDPAADGETDEAKKQTAEEDLDEDTSGGDEK